MEIACVQTSPISFVARGKGNRRRLHAGKYGKVLENVEALLSLFSKYKLFVYGIELWTKTARLIYLLFDLCGLEVPTI